MLTKRTAIGVLGPHGAGAAEHLGALEDVDVVMGTFSKSLASVGGFIAGPKPVVVIYLTAYRSFSALCIFGKSSRRVGRSGGRRSRCNAPGTGAPAAASARRRRASRRASDERL